MRARGWVIVACLGAASRAAGDEPPGRTGPPGVEAVAEDGEAGRAGVGVEPAAVGNPDAGTTGARVEGSVVPEWPASPEGPVPVALAAAVPDKGIASPEGPPAFDSDLGAHTEITLDKSSRVGGGVALGGPIGAAARLRLMHGVAADVREPDTRVNAVCALPIPHCAEGFLIQVEAGSGGGKLSLGLGARARVDDEDFHGTVGMGLRASLVRTWGSPVGTRPGLSYLGPELDLSVKHVDLTLGVLWRLGGQEGPSALLSWAVGFGS